MNKSVKSVIGKLSREEFTKNQYKTKTGESPITKEILEGIAKALGISYQDIAGLEKSPKADLKVLVATLTQEEAQ